MLFSKTLQSLRRGLIGNLENHGLEALISYQSHSRLYNIKQEPSIYALPAINPRGLSKDPYCCTSRAAIDNETNHPENAFAMQKT